MSIIMAAVVGEEYSIGLPRRSATQSTLPAGVLIVCGVGEFMAIRCLMENDVNSTVQFLEGILCPG